MNDCPGAGTDQFSREAISRGTMMFECNYCAMRFRLAEMATVVMYHPSRDASWLLPKHGGTDTSPMPESPSESQQVKP